MKARFIILLLAVSAFSVSMAQTHFEPNIAIGVKGGAVLSRQNFQPSVPQTLLAGYLGGVMFRYMEEKTLD